MEKILLALGDRMRLLRKRMGDVSQEDFADHCGLHRTAVSLLERGKRVPSLRTLLVISSGFGISLSELLKGIDRSVTKKSRPKDR